MRLLIVTDERISSRDSELHSRTAMTGSMLDLLNGPERQVTVLCRRWDAPGHSVPAPPNLRVIHLPEWSGRTLPTAMARIARRIAETLADGDWTHIVAFGPGVASWLTGRRLGRTSSKDRKTLVLIRGNLVEALTAALPAAARVAAQWVGRLVHSAEMRAMAGYDGRIYVSRSLADYFGEPAAKISPEIDWASLERDTAGGEDADGGRERVVLYVGRLSREKNPRTAVEAFCRVARPGWKMKVIGAGPCEPALRRLVQRAWRGLGTPPVQFCGRLSHAAVQQEFRRCAIVLVPSLTEAFGLVAFEALMAGATVLHSGVGGLPEAVGTSPRGIDLGSVSPVAWARELTSAMDACESGAGSAAAPWDGLSRSGQESLEAFAEETYGWVNLEHQVRAGAVAGEQGE